MKKEILYQEIARTIACQIKKGVWKAGEKLPSLRTISNENGDVYKRQMMDYLIM